MAFDFNANEIFDIARQLEQNGALFYRTAAENVEGEEEKSFLLELASMEDDHEKIFADMQKDLSYGETKATVFDPDEETALYLKALADTRIFYEKKAPGKEMKKILLSAIQTEKDTIVFYLGMKEFVPEKLGKNKLDGIIKEEMGHISLLADRLVKLK